MNKIIYSEKLRDPRWQKKRLEIMQRDGFKCHYCTDDKTELHVHHIKYSHTGNPWDAVDDHLITLCKHCHLIVEVFKEINYDLLTIEKKGAFYIAYYSDSDGILAGIMEFVDGQTVHLISLGSQTMVDIMKTLSRLEQEKEA